MNQKKFIHNWSKLMPNPPPTQELEALALELFNVGRIRPVKEFKSILAPGEWLALATHVQQLKAQERQSGLVEASDVCRDAANGYVGGSQSERLCTKLRGMILQRANLIAQSALSPEPVGDGWRPIDSAPKDGTVVIGALFNGGKIWRVYDMRHNGVAWYTINGNGVPEPTLWMPLPPPASKGKDGR